MAWKRRGRASTQGLRPGGAQGLGLDVGGVISVRGKVGIVGSGSAVLRENFSGHARFGGATGEAGLGSGEGLGGVNFMQPHSPCHKYMNTIEDFGVSCGGFYSSSGRVQYYNAGHEFSGATGSFQTAASGGEDSYMPEIGIVGTRIVCNQKIIVL
jgi:hypothetical protein